MSRGAKPHVVTVMIGVSHAAGDVECIKRAAQRTRSSEFEELAAKGLGFRLTALFQGSDA